MTVTGVTKDRAALTMTVTAEFAAPATRVWTLFANPRLLERWWGPPTYPATFVDHDFVPGGLLSYYMTSPEGEKYHGWWRIIAIDAPRALRFEDGFSHDSGEPNTDMPVTQTHVSITEHRPGHTEMTIVSAFASAAAMDQLLTMGMEEGMVGAMGQMDALIAD